MKRYLVILIMMIVHFQSGSSGEISFYDLKSGFANNNPLPAVDVFQNPAALEAKVMERVLATFPFVANIFPDHSATNSLTNQNTRGLRFFIGQSQARDVIQYDKIVASIAYTQTNPRKEYLKEERQGLVDFYIFANQVDVTIDVKPSFPMWQQSATQIAAAYNIQQNEKRQMAARTGTTQSFQSKKAYPGQSWGDYMTVIQEYHYAIAENRNYLGVTGELYAYLNKCTTQGYPREFYNGLVYEIFQGEVPTEIEARARLVRGNNEIFMRINTKAIRNQGLPDRILGVHHVDNLMNTLVRIILEEIGETPPVRTETPVTPINQPVNQQTQGTTSQPVDLQTQGTTEPPVNNGNLVYETIKNIPILQATMSGFNLFDNGIYGVPYGHRKYSTRFSLSSVKSLCWELDLRHPALDVRRAVLSEVIIFDPNDDAAARYAFDIVIEPGLESSQNILKMDLRYFKFPGKYRIELYIFGVKYAFREFIITK